MFRAIVLAASVAISIIWGAHAQDDGPASPANPCEAAPYTDFDFWLGDWEVRSADGTLQGHNLITKAENGCLILEQWTSASGSTGQSYNFFDPGLEAWRQVWVSQGITVDYKGGVDSSGAMVLFGEISYRNGATAPFKGRWEAAEDGSVVQSFEQYDLESDAWTEWFTGYYTLKTDSPAE